MRVLCGSLVIAMLVVAGCEDSDTSVNVVGKIGWIFNYRDWSKPLCPCAGLAEAPCTADAACSWSGTACSELVAGDCTVDDVRTCNNLPAQLYGAPAYPAVATVRVLLEEKTRGTRSVDRDFDCALGGDAHLLELQGMPRSLHRLTLTALAADGTVLYVLETSPDVDFSEYLEARYELRTPSGDLSFDVDYPGSGTACTLDAECTAQSESCDTVAGACDVGVGLCPSLNITSLHYELTKKNEATPTVTGTATPACDPQAFGNIFSNKLYIRNIPSAPTVGSTGGLIPTPYSVKVEAQDASNNTVYCGEIERYVNPGLNANHSSQPMLFGDCPVWSCSPVLYDASDGCDCECGRYDPDCDRPNIVLKGCDSLGGFSRCAGAFGNCECIDYYTLQTGVCTWANQPSGVPPASTIDNLTPAEQTTLCTWIVNRQGGRGFVHNCGGPSITVGSVNQCLTDHNTATCTVSVVEACYDAIAGNPCDLNTHPTCTPYLACL